MAAPAQSSPGPSTGGNGRRAHRRGEARTAILNTARAEFGSKGYSGTLMKDIAQQAEVSEALLYRYFPAKDALFEQAVVEPYHRFVESFLDSWATLDDRLSNEEMVSRFVVNLYDFVLENRDLLFALVVADRFGEPEIEETGLLSAEVQRLAEFTAREADVRGIGDVDLEMAASCTVAMVFSMALLDDLLFAKGANHPTKERLVKQMCLYAAAGVQQKSRPRTSGV
jgi:AcrR family transcriptional regulator